MSEPTISTTRTAPARSTFHRRALAALCAGMVYLTACSDDPGLFAPLGGNGPASMAYDAWVPGPNDSCTAEIHNRYAAVGPDGKLYPTWHPPVDPETGCTFGHEHGRDPRGSSLYDEAGPILFGYANEQLDTYDPGGMRHEDHVGHKIEWEDDVAMRFDSEVADALLELRCDVLAKMHQGSHSKDAFTNNVHEIVYHVRCSEGTRFGVTMLTSIGDGGEFVSRCDDTHVQVGPPAPLNSPDGGGKRRIPDRSCVEAHLLVPEGERSNYGQALRESWQLSERVRTVDGRRLVSFNPYFNVHRPSRFYDAAAPDLVGRPMDVCYEETADGRRVRGGACEEATGDGTITGIPFDDPRSPFRGVHRDMDVNNVTVDNVGGPEVWYTDPYGKNAQISAFPGSIRQYIASVESPVEIRGNGGVIGRDRDYGGPGVHAPN